MKNIPENQDYKRSNTDLVSMAFNNINAFKRHRVLAEAARHDGNTSKAVYHELKQYKHIDNLELELRAIQKGLRALDDLQE